MPAGFLRTLMMVGAVVVMLLATTAALLEFSPERKGLARAVLLSAVLWVVATLLVTYTG